MPAATRPGFETDLEQGGWDWSVSFAGGAMKRGVGLFGLISNINNVQQHFSKSTYHTFKKL